MNSVQLIGRLTRDPELARTSNDVPMAHFRLAVERPGQDEADFVTVKTWGRTAVVVGRHLRRGRRVAVEGRLEHFEWTTDDGQRRERLTVVADRITFLDAPTAQTTSPSPTARSQRESAASPSS